MSKTKIILLVLGFLPASGVIAEVIVPYRESFDNIPVGNSFAEWMYPFGHIYGDGLNPFGQSDLLDGRYLWISGSEAQGAILSLSEYTDRLIFECDFVSLPNPLYQPTGVSRGGANFFIVGDAPHPRNPGIGITFDADIWKDTTNVEVKFEIYYHANPRYISESLGYISNGETYHLSIALGDGIVNAFLSGSDKLLSYTGLLPDPFIAQSIVIGEGGYPGDEYGLAIDNVTIIPEPATMLLIGLGGLMIRRNY